MEEQSQTRGGPGLPTQKVGMLRRFLLGAAALGLARCEELEFEDEEVVEKRPFPKTFEDMIWMAPPANVTMLTLETFDELTANKTCFINFCASWLTACAPRGVPAARVAKPSRHRGAARRQGARPELGEPLQGVRGRR